MSWQESYDEETLRILREVIKNDELIALFLSRKADVEELAKGLDWKSFEKLTAMIFESLGYSTLTNLRIGRKELDVVAYNEMYVFAADCKHWKRMSNSAIARAAEMQKARAKLLLGLLSFRDKIIIPLIVSLYESDAKIINEVPVVPVLKLRDFLISFYGYIDSINVIRGP
ncbi:MAG: restriction endonuclease [Nitrososphaeria archaeon]